MRSQRDPDTLLPSIREAIARLDSQLALGSVRTLEQIKTHTLSNSRQSAAAIGTFAAVAALLAALGLYGVLSQAVWQQRREIGIRMAMGAAPRAVMIRTLRTGLSMIVVGLALGLAGSLALTRLMTSLLFEVSPLDPIALGGAAAAMALLGLFAGALPASRAASLDPVIVLREES